MLTLQVAKNRTMGKFQMFTFFTKKGKPFKGSASTAPFPCKLNRPLKVYDSSLTVKPVEKFIDGDSEYIYVYGFSDSEALIKYQGACSSVPLNHVIEESIQWHVEQASVNYMLDEQSKRAFLDALSSYKA